MTPEATGATERGDGGAGRGLADDAIDRLVAERVMGFTYDGAAWWTHPDGKRTSVDGLPRVCTDPAAWGALYQHLTTEGYEVMLVYMPTLTRHESRVKLWDWQDFGKTKRGSGEDPALPGRALALAALRAYGVEVEG